MSHKPLYLAGSCQERFRVRGMLSHVRLIRLLVGQRTAFALHFALERQLQTDHELCKDVAQTLLSLAKVLGIAYDHYSGPQLTTYPPASSVRAHELVFCARSALTPCLECQICQLICSKACCCAHVSKCRCVRTLSFM